LTFEISNKDKRDWENFLTNDESLTDKDAGIKKKKSKKISTFDFHGYSLDQANIKITDLIHNAYNNQIFKLVIVTGKGLHSQNHKNPYVSKDFGILRYSLPEFIKNSSELMKMVNDIETADIEDGGSGAFYIYLKKKL
jgi:DNA-nicking Smr family endonuclease